MKRSKSKYENDIAALIGKQLKRVRYFEICYDTNLPHYLNDAFSGHLLDYGCDLEMRDGSIFGIIWDWEYFQYGIGITQTSLSTKLSGVRVWEVTNDKHWANLIGQTIAKVKVYWSWVQSEGSSEKIYYPQDVEVEFSNACLVFFSSSQYNQEKDALWGISDDIAIIFDKDAAKRYNIGPYAAQS